MMAAIAMTLAEAFKVAAIKKTWSWVWSALPVIVLLELQAVAPLGHWSLLPANFDS
jgi:hypothetical protein